MDPLVTGSLISGGANLLGSLLGKSNNHAGRDARQALDYSIEQSVLGKVNAAKKAGVSPLYALGAPVMGTSWGQVGGDSGLGQALSSMGQDVGRAVAAQQTAPERRLQDLTLEKAALENEYLRSQIASIRTRTAQQAGPPGVGLVPENVQHVQATRPGANVLGGVFRTSPRTSDLGQFGEDRFGEDSPLTWLLGGAAFLDDLEYNLYSRLPVGYRTPAEAGTTVRRWLTGK